MTNDIFEVVVSGHLCLDILPRMGNISPDALASPGKLFEVGPLDLATGGVVSNTGQALNTLGVNACLMANVGQDVVGQIIIDALNKRDESLSRFITVCLGEPSSYSVVLSPAHSDRTFLHCTGTNSTFGVENIDFLLLEKSKLFHLGYPPLLPRLAANDGAELVEVYRRAKATGVVTSLDMALPDPNGPSGRINWDTCLKNVMPYVDIFLPSIEEILFMLRRADYDQWQRHVLPHLTLPYLHALADDLLDRGGVIVGFKLGEMGLYLRTADAARFNSRINNNLSRLALDVAAWADQEFWTPAYQVDVVNTTGAGDSAYAGLLAALLHGLPPREAVQLACAVGACNVEAADASSGVRSWLDTQARIASNWPVRSERLADK